MSGPALVHCQTHRGVAEITLDSPGNRNALSAPLRRQFDAALRQAIAASEVRAILLAATGPAFCAGVDLKEAAAERAGQPPDPDAPSLSALLELVMGAPKPVVVKVAGPARAGGIGLVAAADIALAAESVSFAFTEVRIGVVPAVISVPVSRCMSPRALRRYFLTGETFDAAAAADSGLLTRAVPDTELDSAVAETLQGLRAGEPTALADTKQRLCDAAAEWREAEFARMGELSRRYFDSAAAAEGRAAFAERRPPEWVL